MAHVGGVRQVMPPWLGSWIVPMPAPWCAYCRGAGAAFVAVHGAAEFWRMVVPWPCCNLLGGGVVCFVCPPPVGEFDGVVVIHALCCNSCPL